MSIEIFISILVMALLFLRQVSILKNPYKISYTSIILVIGFTTAMLHFIISDGELVHLLKESLVAPLVALLLFSVINMLHQAQKNEQQRQKQEDIKHIDEELKYLRGSLEDLETRLLISINDDKTTKDESRDIFKQDFKMLDTLILNQNKIFERFDKLALWQDSLSKEFKNFAQKEIPSLDDIMHKHLSLLRSEESEHFEKIRHLFLENRLDARGVVDELKVIIANFSKISQSVSVGIISHISKDIKELVGSLESQLSFVANSADGINTALLEGHTRLNNIKNNSETVMRQMVLSSKKMGEIEKLAQKIEDITKNSNQIFEDLKASREDYERASISLKESIKSIQISNLEYKNSLREELEVVVLQLNQKVDELVRKLQDEERLESISKDVQLLAKKAQFKNSYLDIES